MSRAISWVVGKTKASQCEEMAAIIVSHLRNDSLTDDNLTNFSTELPNLVGNPLQATKDMGQAVNQAKDTLKVLMDAGKKIPTLLDHWDNALHFTKKHFIGGQQLSVLKLRDE